MPYRPPSANDPDLVRFRSLNSVAGIALLVGGALIAQAGFGSFGGVVRGIAGISLIAAALFGLRYLWKTV